MSTWQMKQAREREFQEAKAEVENQEAIERAAEISAAKDLSEAAMGKG